MAVTGSAVSLAPSEMSLLDSNLNPIAIYGVRFQHFLMVRDALPAVIERADGEKIRIFKYARVTRDTYDVVRRVSKEIWNGQRSLFLPVPKSKEEEEDKLDISLVLHLGMMALSWEPDQFRFETVARRDGYALPGDEDQYVNSKELEELGLPKALTTSFDIEAAWCKAEGKFRVSIRSLYRPSITPI